MCHMSCCVVLPWWIKGDEERETDDMWIVPVMG